MKLFSALLASVILVGCVGGTSEASDTASVDPAAPTAETDIWTAASLGDNGAIQDHLDAGQEISETFVAEGVPGTGGSPLHIAAITRQTDSVEYLIEAGAEIEKKADDEYRGTPMHWAAIGADEKTVTALLEAGADPNSTDKDGNTPLNAADYNADVVERRAIVETLEAAGAKRAGE